LLYVYGSLCKLMVTFPSAYSFSYGVQCRLVRL